MRRVIGEFSTFAEAQRAVRELEHHLSVQDVVLRLRGATSRRGLRARSHDRSRSVLDTLVLMTAEHAVTTRARVLLQQSEAQKDVSRDSWHALTSEEVAGRADSDPRVGLSHAEVGRRTQTFGVNSMPLTRGRSKLRMLLDQFRSPLIYLLFAAASVAFALGRVRDATVILIVLALNALIGTFQELRAERSLRALGRITSHKVQVLRAGVPSTVDASEVVPGDILLLQAGDAVGADARIMESAALQTGESALTGESAPVDKSSTAVQLRAVLGDRASMVYAGTHVTKGRARAMAVDTGVATQMGRIAHLTGAARTPATPLELRIHRLGRQVMWAALGLFVVVVSVGLLRDVALVDIAMIALSQVVGMIPEGLPVAVTIALAVGVQRMAARGAIVRDIAAVETLGSTTVVCTDKTGTLTQNEMTVTAVALADGRAFRISGGGYAPFGDFFFGEQRIDARADPALRALIEAAALCSDAELIAPSAQQGAWLIVGDPTEAALITLALKAGVDLIALRETSQRRAERPFEASARSMAVEVESAGKRRIYIKGAPEVVMALCDPARQGGAEPVRARSERELASLPELEGLRLLAVAVLEEQSLDHGFDLRTSPVKPTFLGVLGQLDPPRPEARAAVASCRAAGIRTVMITGDHASTGVSVARSVGLFADGDRAMDGPELEALSDDALAALVDHVAVFTRVHPAQKLRIVDALQVRGHVVAMTGDGVNDAPALARADVGVAMGRSGTEVAREAAKMVLTDDNFATLRAAVEEGRGIYRNLRKVILLLLTTSAAEVVVLLGALALGFPPPFTAVQILWINLVSEGLITVNLVMERKEGDEMSAKPVPKSAPLLDRTMFVRATLMIATIVSVTLGWFVWRSQSGAPLAQLQTETFTMVVLCAWFNALNCRFEARSSVLASPAANPWLLFGIGAGALAHALVLFFRPLGDLFETVPIGWKSCLAMVAVASSVLWIEELRKVISRAFTRRAAHRALIV